jgi:polyphosphate glucokinase
VRKAIRNLRSLTSFDHLYIGGGNARKIAFELDPDVTIVSNAAGITGGIALWRE